jgi:hypothetical protein
MIACDNCQNTFSEKKITAVTPSEHLGGNFPAVVKLCQDCLAKFLEKMRKNHKEVKDTKLDNFRIFINE